MRKLVAYELLSLDGVAEAPDRFFGWDDVMDANLASVIASQDAVILGRRSYDEWAGYWPTSDIEPFATFINRAAKYVASSKPLDVEWANTTRIEGDVAEFVRELKGRGVRLLDETPRVGAGGCRVAFVHPKAAGGVLLELKQQ